ncbi:pyruvate kinase [bacterium]|nr:pyruvate kinase [bacterium]
MQKVSSNIERRTKIVATLGPASSSVEVLSDLIEAGVDVFRLNFSHGCHADHSKAIEIVREQATLKNRHVGIMGDLQGPKIRIGQLQQDSMELANGQEIVLTIDASSANSLQNRIHVTYEPLPTSVHAEDILLLDDGRIRLLVKSTSTTDVVCEVTQAGPLSSRKGINRLGGGLAADAITEKDLEDLQCIIENNLEFVAVSFPCRGSDLLPVRDALTKAGSEAKIIAKIERAEVVANDANLQELIDAADGVMVARGDLGVEIGDPQLIGIQKKIIKMARKSNKPVITATQMMESMITQPVPTRAEVFDVANAVLDCTDAVMLSGETATGAFPVKVVEAMSETAIGAEKHPTMVQSGYRVERIFTQSNECIALSAMYAANHLEGISAIVCLSESGNTPLIASRIRSGLPIYGVSRNLMACRRMALMRGVIPLYFDPTQNDDVGEAIMSLIAERGELLPGQRIAFTCGDSPGEGGSSNTLKLLTYRA